MLGLGKVRKCSDSIPVDLLIDIFSRVSAKSIARFRCVSKLWAYVLLLPDFTELFLSKSRTRTRLLFYLEVGRTLIFYFSPQPQNLDDHDKECCVVATSYHKYYLPEHFYSRNDAFVCGLALLKGYCSEGWMICNPVTGEFLTLPKVKGHDSSDLYFGYDPISKQYKVLRTASPTFGTINSYLVLRLETGNIPSWKRIESEFDFMPSYRIIGEICINGVLYFGARLDGSYVIVSFDVRSEKFGFIKIVEVEEEMSRRVHRYRYNCPTLINSKGKLGILRCVPGELVLWVLEDAGNHKWSEHVHAFSDSETSMVRRKRFRGMSGNGELVWYSSSPFYILYYNLEMKTFTRVNVKGFQEFKESHYIALRSLDYVEDINRFD